MHAVLLLLTLILSSVTRESGSVFAVDDHKWHLNDFHLCDRLCSIYLDETAACRRKCMNDEAYEAPAGTDMHDVCRRMCEWDDGGNPTCEQDCFINMSPDVEDEANETSVAGDDLGSHAVE